MATTNSMKEQGEKTRELILQTGLKLWPDITPSAVATKLGISHATVLYHFPDIKEAVAQYALDTDCSKVIVQMIVSNHKLTRKMSGQERLKHFANAAKS